MYKMKDTSGNTYLMNIGKTTVTRSYSYDKKYDTAGTYYWTCPSGCSSVKNVQVAGGGGGYGWNCQCNCCSCGDSCVISGKVLTKQGYVDIADVKVGMVLLSEQGKDCIVKGIVTGKLQHRKAVEVGNCVFTDDHSYIAPNGRKCTVNFGGYVQSLSREVQDGDVKGKYVRQNLLYLAKDTDLDFVVKEMPEDTKTYTLIVDGADFVQMDGVTASCARFFE